MPRYLKFPRTRTVPGAGAAFTSSGRRGRVIGLLGGSFNPAHAGHRHVSLLALRRLGLAELWWMVSPQNPLKPVAGMAPFAERLAAARAMARHPKIRVTGVEAELGTTYTAETLRRLTRRRPRLRFVWLMGADNLQQVTQWRDWQRIFNAALVAVLPRPSYALRALAGQAAKRFCRSRLPEGKSRLLGRERPPAWVFLSGPLDPTSATAIREGRRATKRRT